jgi:hypothetical protein
LGVLRGDGLGRTLDGGLVAQPLGFHEIFEQLRNGTAALESELFREIPDFGVDGQVQFSAKFPIWISDSRHLICEVILFVFVCVITD